MNKTLIIVDDDLPFRDRLSKSMEKRGFDVESFSSAKSSSDRIKEKNFDFAIVDMRLDDGSGLELIKIIQSHSPNTRSLLLTGYGNIATAVAAIKSGAIDYLPKPAEIDQIYNALTYSKSDLPPNLAKHLFFPNLLDFPPANIVGKMLFSFMKTNINH